MEFTARMCSSPVCRLRVPVEVGSALARRCPACGEPMTDGGPRWSGRPGPRAVGPGSALELVLDNVRSVRNVGSILRTAEAAGVRHLHACGITPPPSHPKIPKTALGAEARVPWSRHRDAVAAVEALRDAGMSIWALEGGPRAIPIDAARRPTDAAVALVAGHEVAGVDARVVAIADQVVALPMHGEKASLNVSVAIGIALYALAGLVGPDAARAHDE